MTGDHRQYEPHLVQIHEISKIINPLLINAYGSFVPLKEK